MVSAFSSERRAVPSLDDVECRVRPRERSTADGFAFVILFMRRVLRNAAPAAHGLVAATGSSGEVDYSGMYTIYAMVMDRENRNQDS